MPWRGTRTRLPGRGIEVASISRRTVGGRPRFDVNYGEPDGRRRRKTFQKKADAERFSATVEADKVRGAYIDPDAGRITFKTYADDWLSTRTFSESTREGTALRLRLHVYPVLGHRRLANIRPSTVQAWLKTLDHLAPKTRHLIFAAAVDDERIPKNPAKAGSVRAPRVEPRKVIPWEAARVAAMHEALSDRYVVVVTLAAGLGLRQGEVFRLSPDDVDFLRGRVAVKRQVKVYGGNRLAFALPKHGKTRTIPLPGSVRDELAAYLRAHPARRCRCHGTRRTGSR